MKVYRNRALLTMAGAESVSNVGNWIAMAAIYAMLIWQQGGGVGQSAVIYLTGLGPSLLLGPLAGWLCDRVDRRTLLIASELLSGLCVAALIFTTQVGWIYALLALQAVCGTVMAPARSSVVPDVVSEEDLTRANAFLIQLNGLTRIVAPLVGSLAVAVISPRTALTLDVVSFVLSALLLSFLPKLPPRREQPLSGAAEEAGQKGGPIETLRAVYRQAPQVRFLFPIMLVLGVLITAFDIVAAVYVRDVMHAGIAFKGVIAAVVGSGMVLSALVLMLLKGERNPWRDFISGALLMAALPGAFALGDLVGNVWLARAVVLAGCLAGAVGMGWANVQGQVLTQRIAPDGWLGRFAGVISSVMVLGQVVGMFATPLLTPSVVSFGVYFGVGALVLVLICLGAGLAMGVWRPAVKTAANEVATGD